MSRHQIAREGVDLGQFSDELSARLGRRVVVTLSPPPQGGKLGQVVVRDEVDEEVDVDDEAVAAAIAAHVPPAVPADPLDALASALTGANTIAKLRDALGGYVAAEKASRRPGVPNVRRAGGATTN